MVLYIRENSHDDTLQNYIIMSQSISKVIPHAILIPASLSAYKAFQQVITEDNGRILLKHIIRN